MGYMQDWMYKCVTCRIGGTNVLHEVKLSACSDTRRSHARPALFATAMSTSRRQHCGSRQCQSERHLSATLVSHPLGTDLVSRSCKGVRRQALTLSASIRAPASMTNSYVSSSRTTAAVRPAAVLALPLVYTARGLNSSTCLQRPTTQ